MPTSRHRKKQKHKSHARAERIKSEAGQIKNLMQEFQKNLEALKKENPPVSNTTLLTAAETTLPI